MAAEFRVKHDYPVLVIGAAGVDLVGRLRADLQFQTSNPAQIRTAYGGVGRNIAENLARLGQPVRLLTVVGQDESGDQLLAQAEAAGVDVSAALRSTKHPTGSYLAVVNPRGELQLALDDMRAMRALSPAYLQQQAALFEQASLVFLDNNLPEATLHTAIALAQAAHIPVCADPTSSVLAPRLLPFLKDLYLLNPNQAEAGLLAEIGLEVTTQEQALEAAKRLVGRGVKVAIVLMPSYAVAYANSNTSGMIPPVLCDILDPTGAGDALTAAVLFGLLNGIDLDESVRLGMTAASLTLRHQGAVVPDLSLEKLYDELVI